MIQLASDTRIIRRSVALAVGAAALVLLTPTAAQAAKPPGPSITLNSVQFDPTAPLSTNCSPFIQLTVSGLSGGPPAPAHNFHVWNAFGEVTGSSTFTFGPIQFVVNDNGIEHFVFPSASNGLQPIPNGKISQWTLTLQDPKGAVVATSSTVTVTASCQVAA